MTETSREFACKGGFSIYIDGRDGKYTALARPHLFKVSRGFLEKVNEHRLIDLFIQLCQICFLTSNVLILKYIAKVKFLFTTFWFIIYQTSSQCTCLLDDLSILHQSYPTDNTSFTTHTQEPPSSPLFASKPLLVGPLSSQSFPALYKQLCIQSHNTLTFVMSDL